MADRPVWRRGFDRVERAVGSRLEDAVQTEQFADAVAILTRLQVGSRHWVEQRTRRAWHLVNLPAGSDVRRLSEQVVALDRRLRDVTVSLEELRRENSDAADRPDPGRPAEPGAQRRRPRRTARA